MEWQGKNLRRVHVEGTELFDFGRDVGLALEDSENGERAYVLLSRYEMQGIFNLLWQWQFRPMGQFADGQLPSR